MDATFTYYLNFTSYGEEIDKWQGKGFAHSPRAAEDKEWCKGIVATPRTRLKNCDKILSTDVKALVNRYFNQYK